MKYCVNLKTNRPISNVRDNIATTERRQRGPVVGGGKQKYSRSLAHKGTREILGVVLPNGINSSVSNCNIVLFSRITC